MLYIVHGYCIQNYTNLNNLQPFSLMDINNLWIITFDFESLYTNVTSDYVNQMLLSAYNFHMINETTLKECKLLYNFMQLNTFFHIGHKRFYRQINGLSMGSYDAQSTANNTLLFHEFDLLQESIIKDSVLLYNRYIDDGFMIAKGNPTTIQDIVTTTANFLPNKIPIDFTIRKFSNNFLDLWVKLDYDSFIKKKFSYHIYQKEFNTYSYIHRTSNHPRRIFEGIVKTENIRYERKSSSYIERSHIRKLFTTRLVKQGYKPQECVYKRTYKQKRSPLQIKDKKIVKIVFNQSHGFNMAAKQIIKKAISCQNRKILTVYRVNKKTRQVLLTKKSLHSKIGHYI